MDDAFLACLRCPIDPQRESTLTRDQQTLICICRVTFPVKNGLPVLIADEATLPDDLRHREQLPCVRRAARSRQK